MSLLAEPKQRAEFAALADRYQRDPIAFFVEVLAVDPDTIWPGMHAMAESVRDNKRTAVAACHDSSKTFTAACLAWWWVMVFMPAKVITTAPGARQVRSSLWDEIHKLYNQARIPLGGRLLQSEWVFAPGTFMLGLSTREDTGAGGATRFQGFKSPNNLVIFDEATQIARGIWEATQGLIGMPNSRWVALANPTDPASEFRRCFRPQSPWHAINISAFDTPNLIAGEIVNPHTPTPERIEEYREEYGVDHPIWEARVLGQFPSSAVGTLISQAEFDAASLREHGDIRSEPVSIGCDVALEGDDLTVIVVIKGPCIMEIEKHAKRKGDFIGDRIAELADLYGITTAQGFRISIDSTGGYGEAPENRLRNEHGYRVRGENFGSLPAFHPDDPKKRKFRNRRTELWCEMADWIRDEACWSNAKKHWLRSLEDDLPGCLIYFNEGQIRHLEQKKDMKKRLGHSPDYGDALALALAWRSRAAAARPVEVRKPADPDEEEYRREELAKLRKKTRLRPPKRRSLEEHIDSVGGGLP